VTEVQLATSLVGLEDSTVRVGVDLVDVDRIQKLLDDHPDGVTDLFTSREIAYCRRKRHHAMHFAARFAAKEAVLKAFGTGMGRYQRWTDVETVNGPFGKPEVLLHGETAARAERGGLIAIDVSLTHSPTLAMAGVVTIWSKEGEPCGST